MALSGSFDFTLDRDALITTAIRLVGGVGAGQTPTAVEITDAGVMLNLMLKSWQNDGLQLWTVTRKQITPVQGQSVYTMGATGDSPDVVLDARPEDIFEAYRRTTSTEVDVPLIRLSRQDYWTLSDKDEEGVPVQFYFDPQLTLANLYIWPTADSIFAANNTIDILYQRPFDDMDSATDNLYFPQSWELSVVLGLAALLTIEYGATIADRRELKAEAALAKEVAMEWDSEHTSMFLQAEPDFKRGY